MHCLARITLALLVAAVASASRGGGGADDLDAWHVPTHLHANLGWNSTSAAHANAALSFFEQLYDAVNNHDSESLTRMLAPDVVYTAHSCSACAVLDLHEDDDDDAQPTQAKAAPTTSSSCHGTANVVACLERDADERRMLCAHLGCSAVSYRISVLGERVQVARVVETYNGAATGKANAPRMLDVYYMFLVPTDASHVRVRALERVRTPLASDYEAPAASEWDKRATP